MKLHGFPISNYYNMVKMALLEKGIAFEEVYVKPNQNPEFLAISPMGKVPCLETDEGMLTETGVILEYLEDLGVGPALYPSEAFARAKVRELLRYLELYIELPARRLYGDVFFGKPASEAEKQAVRLQLEKGFAALPKLAVFGPYMAADEFTVADIYFLYSMTLATRVTKKALDWDTFNTVAGVRDLVALLSERDSAQRIAVDQKADTFQPA